MISLFHTFIFNTFFLIDHSPHLSRNVMKSVQIYKKILLSRVDIFRKMLLFRPSDIKMAKNMMDGPVWGCFIAIFGTVRHEIAPKVVGRCLEAMRSDSQSVMSDWSEEMGVYFGSTRQRRICDSLRWRTL